MAMDSLADHEAPMLPLDLPAATAPKDNEGLPIFTGEAFFYARPTEYKIALALAAEGNSLRSISRVIGASKNTVQAILARERLSMTMERYREGVAVRLRNSLAQALDRIDEAMQDDERMEKASPRDLAYLMKELAEKMQLFSGGATHRTGHQDEGKHVGDMDYLRMIQQAEAVPVEAVERGAGDGGRGTGDGESGEATDRSEGET